MTDQPQWLPATTSFIEADVVRWTEAIWSKKKRGRGKRAKNIVIGKQRVTGQITQIDKDYVYIKVIEAEMVDKDGAKDSSLRRAGDIIRKKPKTLVNGGLERLLWESEEARASIIAEKTQNSFVFPFKKLTKTMRITQFLYP